MLLTKQIVCSLIETRNDFLSSTKGYSSKRPTRSRESFSAPSAYQRLSGRPLFRGPLREKVQRVFVRTYADEISYSLLERQD